MPKINRYDPLSYPLNYNIQGDAIPLTFPEPVTVEELLLRLHQWLIAARWRQKGWMRGAKNIETPECACLLGAVVICRLGGKNPHQQPRGVDLINFGDLLTDDILCARAMELLHYMQFGTSFPDTEAEQLALIKWQDHPARAYSEVIGLVRTVIDYLGLNWSPNPDSLPTDRNIRLSEGQG